MRTEPLSSANERAALQYLTRSPYLNVFITHVVLHDPPSRARKDLVIAVDENAVRGVAYCGRQLAIAADPPALPSFAEYARRRRGERMIVGPRETVRAFWALVAGWHPRPRLVRDRQLVMMLDRAHFRACEPSVTVRHARAEEAAAVADGSAQMVRQELDYDPRRASPEFSAAVRRMVDRQLWWVGLDGDAICFFCNIGPWCEKTVQLQGIWTPPALRGRGLATASLAAICDRLLEVSPTVSLYVNDFNERAVALYRRVGFEHVGDFQTILF
ncbi:MAG: GNAT family N-acetyltransferase [Candidatus Eremiobacteraeota bacterium]|nr:GNAT family N-acetyltransferase [Candidatus Eremiobacteraeota bacterium]